MAIKCGTDIIYIPRLTKLLQQESTLQKFFHSAELKDNRAEHLAGIIAAKEAFFKALGIAPPHWRAVEITYEANGKPVLVVTPELQMYRSCDVSISHDQEYAIAMVVLEV